jgi:two-component sensor histidine kinase
MVRSHEPQAKLLPLLPLAKGEAPWLRGAVTRLWPTLSRCRAALLTARLIARPGHDAAPGGSDADITSRALSTKLSLLSEQLDEAGRALAQATSLASTLIEALERERATVRYKDLLLREADHRIKSSLQALASLLRVRANRSSRPEAAKALRLGSTHIEAVGKVHAILQGNSGEAAYLDLDVYLRGVCKSLGKALRPDGDGGEIVVEVEPVMVEASVGQALGIAVSELVANAFQHAFALGFPGTVWVQGMPDTGGGYRLSIADDGHGLPDGLVTSSGPGFGLRLVSLLASQIGAMFEVSSGRGARILLSFPTAKTGWHMPGQAHHQPSTNLHSNAVGSNAP